MSIKAEICGTTCLAICFMCNYIWKYIAVFQIIRKIDSQISTEGSYCCHIIIQSGLIPHSPLQFERHSGLSNSFPKKPVSGGRPLRNKRHRAKERAKKGSRQTPTSRSYCCHIHLVMICHPPCSNLMMLYSPCFIAYSSCPQNYWRYVDSALWIILFR